MHNQRWFEIVLPVATLDVDLATTGLADAGHTSCELRERAGDVTEVVVFVAADDVASAREQARTLEAMLPVAAAGSIAVTGLDDTVWTENWKRFFPPLRIGKRLLILPPWELDAAAETPDRSTIVINPAQAFGTGHHETTAACLEILDRLVADGMRVADVGCGSGVLAIAAVKLGAAFAVANDDDEVAVNAARANAVRNAVDDRVSVELTSGPPAGGKDSHPAFDLAIANIYAEKLIEMADSLTSCVKPGGHLVLSGIESSRESLIMEAFVRSAWPLTLRVEREGWVTLALRHEPDTGGSQ